ncbi:hypothetical protein B484DRAFT_449492 [Ochromonadaceae sp. CCMP2298]|nr:hypothetical protein B484DRAFT_451469 [Ochromonadaceae sp. CCMP2298]KAJ1429287.1 hypothetical protein B484DRAFT_449492 [Ochromonadaceae sp. CCMP2298]
MATSLARFDGTGASLATVEKSSSRLRIVSADRGSSQRYVDRNHLSHSPTCSAWGPLPTAKEGEKKGPSLLAVGFDDGTVVIFDLAKGLAAATLGTVGDSAPSDLCFARDGSSLFVCSKHAPTITQYTSTATTKSWLSATMVTLKSGSKKGLNRLAMNPRVDALAVCGAGVRVLDLQSGRRRKLSGNLPGGVGLAAFSACGRFVIAVAKRQVLVFDARAGGLADEEEGEPVCTIDIPEGQKPTGLETTSGKKDPNTLRVLVLFATSGASVWDIEVGQEAAGVQAQVRIVTTGTVMAGCFFGAGKKELSRTLLLALEVEGGQVFRRVDVGAGEEDGVGAGGSVREVVVSAEGGKDGKEKRPHEGSEGDDQGEGKKNKTEGLILASTDATELSLQARMAVVTPQAPLAAAPTSDSLVTLIDQALQSGDDTLLEQCLACGEPGVVEATAERLPTGRIVLFLRKLVAKFEKRPSRGILLTSWLSSLLRHHKAYLVTVPDLSFQLAGLSQMLEQRLSSHGKISALAGRLDVLMGHVVQGGSKGEVGLPDIVPAQVYVEE